MPHFNETTYRNIMGCVNKLQGLMGKYGKRLKQSDINTITKQMHGLNNLFESYTDGLGMVVDEISGLNGAMPGYLRKYLDAQKVNPTGCSNHNYGSCPVYGTFDPHYYGNEELKDAYWASHSYKMAHSKYDSFGNYDDMQAFMNTKGYHKLGNLMGLSELTNYGLILDYFAFGKLGLTDRYIDKILNGGLRSVIEGIPKPDGKQDFKAEDWLAKKMGYEDGEAAFQDLSQTIQEALEKNVPFQKLINDPRIKKLLESLDKDKLDTHKELLKKIYEDMLDKWAKENGAVKAGKFLAENGLKVYSLLAANYEEQVAYVDAMEAALDDMGYPGKELHGRLDAMRTEYSNKVCKFASDAINDVGDKMVSGISKAAMKGLIKRFPGVAYVDFGLGLIDHTVDKLMADDITAINGLSSLAAYDEALTRTHEGYQGMMDMGIADEEDIANADRIYNILLQTKRSEYEYMIAINQRNHIYDQEKLQQKYDELCELTYSGNDEEFPDRW